MEKTEYIIHHLLGVGNIVLLLIKRGGGSDMPRPSRQLLCPTVKTKRNELVSKWARKFNLNSIPLIYKELSIQVEYLF